MMNFSKNSFSVKLSKEKRKELRKEYEKIQGKKYVDEIRQHTDISLYEWVGFLCKK